MANNNWNPFVMPPLLQQRLQQLQQQHLIQQQQQIPDQGSVLQQILFQHQQLQQQEQLRQQLQMNQLLQLQSQPLPSTSSIQPASLKSCAEKQPQSEETSKQKPASKPVEKRLLTDDKTFTLSSDSEEEASDDNKKKKRKTKGDGAGKKISPEENVENFLSSLKSDDEKSSKSKLSKEEKETVKGVKKGSTKPSSRKSSGPGRPLGSQNKTASKETLRNELVKFSGAPVIGDCKPPSEGTRRSSRLNLVREVESLDEVKKLEAEKEAVNPPDDDDIEPPSKSKTKNKEMVENLKDCIVNNANTSWEDIYGLDSVKKQLKDVVILPTLRPDLFRPGSLREPSNTILLFGPPGTGKTLLGKCCATTAHATFFNIKASDLTSKWIGDGEKLVSTLFQLGEQYKPSILFIDEIDSLLSKRNVNEHEASRKIKTEFLSCLDGIQGRSKNVFVMGTTNRPFDLDHAILRRFTTQLYVPLPDCNDRKKLFEQILYNGKITFNLDDDQLQMLAEKSIRYSPADIAVVCKAAANMPITSLSVDEALAVDEADLRPVTLEDVEVALHNRKPTCPPEIVNEIEHWMDNM